MSLNQRTNRATAGRERGSVSVEMVFILPVLLLICFAIAEFGLAFGRYHLLLNAAHEGVRYAALNHSSCNAATVNTAAELRAEQAFQGLGVVPGAATIVATGACVPGDARVSMEYAHGFPIVSALASLPATLDLTYTAVRATEIPTAIP
jgi:Flp pilus assembly protein TadG